MHIETKISIHLKPIFDISININRAMSEYKPKEKTKENLLLLRISMQSLTWAEMVTIQLDEDDGEEGDEKKKTSKTQTFLYWKCCVFVQTLNNP